MADPYGKAGGGTFVEYLRDEHDVTLGAKKCLVYGFDGSGYNQIFVGPTGAVLVSGTFTPASAAITVPAAGAIAFGALTGSYANLLVNASGYVHLTLLNSTNVLVVVSLDAGVTNHYRIPAGGAVTVELAALGKIGPSTNIQAKHDGTAATRGEISATVIR